MRDPAVDEHDQEHGHGAQASYVGADPPVAGGAAHLDTGREQPLVGDWRA
jgi:hypothetical protein